jgi:hypothetical protein
MLNSSLWCDASLRGTKDMAQLIHQKRKPPKIFLSRFDWRLICSICQTFSGVFPTVTFSTHVTSNSCLHSTSYSLNPFLWLSLSPSLAYSPLHFYLSQFHIKSKWFELPSSLIIRISPYQCFPQCPYNILLCGMTYLSKMFIVQAPNEIETNCLTCQPFA